jgi:hypothetical protein
MQGQLFTQDFLTRGVAQTPPWQAFGAAAFDAFGHHRTLNDVLALLPLLA